jgi:transposase
MTHPPQLILGIDTHKDLHVAVLVDRLGRFLAGASFGTTDAANTELVAWTGRSGQVTSAGWRAPAATATGSPSTSPTRASMWSR